MPTKGLLVPSLPEPIMLSFWQTIKNHADHIAPPVALNIEPCYSTKDGNRSVFKTINYLRLFFFQKTTDSIRFFLEGSIDYNRSLDRAVLRHPDPIKSGLCGLGGWDFDCAQINLRYPKHCRKNHLLPRNKSGQIFSVFWSKPSRSTHIGTRFTKI